MNHQTYPWISFGILLGLASIALFLALPRPFTPGYFILSAVIFGILIGAGLYLSRSAGLNLLLVHNAPHRDFVLTLPLILDRSALIGTGLGTLMLGMIHFILCQVLRAGKLRLPLDCRGDPRLRQRRERRNTVAQAVEPLRT